MRLLFFLVLCLGSRQLNAQTYPDIQETDSLPTRVVFYLPTADNDKLSLIKTEFLKYPQIQSAVFYYGTHRALLLEFAEVVSPKFFTYADIKKQIAHGILVDEIYIKTSVVFNEILNENNIESTKFILK